MESHIMDRVMQEYWQSNLDASGDFLGASTAFGILTNGESKYDYEQLNRFYKVRKNWQIRPHKLNFMVVRRSMEMRYFLEMAFFLFVVVVF